MEQTQKVALITGGGTGIGRAVSLGLAKQGVDIVINYSRSLGEAEATAEEVRALGVSCLVVQADVANDTEVRAMIKTVLNHYGRLDYLVNNAGTTNFVDLPDLEGLQGEYWDRVMNVNVKGTFFVCRAAAPALKEHRGSIVNITSIAGITGVGSSIAYAASKAAAISLTKSLARVLAPEVRVNSVAPGIVVTRWHDGREEFVEKAAEGTLLDRICEPEDIADAAIALLRATAMVTGQTLVVDGGKVIY
jgi:3-oxoacyl-[acyl-carrier protein] reductase